MTVFTLPVVLDVVVKASLILAATALVAATLRRASASARHFVWTLGLLSALVAPALSVALPRWELPLVTIAAPAATSTLAPASGEITRSIVPPNHLRQGSGGQEGGSYRIDGESAAISASAKAPAAAPARRIPSWPAIA